MTHGGSPRPVMHFKPQVRECHEGYDTGEHLACEGTTAGNVRQAEAFWTVLAVLEHAGLDAGQQSLLPLKFIK